MELSQLERQTAFDKIQPGDHVEPRASNEPVQRTTPPVAQPSLPSRKSLLQFGIPTLVVAVIGTVTVGIGLGISIFFGACLGVYAETATNDIRKRINGYTGDIDATDLVGRD